MSSWPRSGLGTLSRRISDDIAVSENMMNFDFDEKKKEVRKMKMVILTLNVDGRRGMVRGEVLGRVL